MCAKKLSTLVSILSVLTVFCSDAQAKSVYAITDHGYPWGGESVPAKITAYGIEGNQIYEQYVYELDQTDYPTGGYLGPVGITSGDGYLFVTHENAQGGIDGIQLIDARTMLDQGVFEVIDSPDFAGIVYDHGNDKIYAIQSQMASGTVLQMDQAAPANQSFLWDICQRRKDASLDSCLRLCTCGDPQKKDRPRPEPLHNSTVFKCVDFRENTYFRSVFATVLQN